jgi:hypothetical protein
MSLFGLLGLILVVVGVFWLISGSLVGGIVLILVGLFLAGGSGFGRSYW